MWSSKPAETKRQGETDYAKKTATDLTQFKTNQVQAAVPERVKEGVGREQGTCSQPDQSNFKETSNSSESIIFYLTIRVPEQNVLTT